MRYGYPVALVLLFAALAGAMEAGVTQPFDSAIRASIHAIASDRLTAFARLFSFIGSNPVWITAAVVATAALWLTAQRKQALALAISMLGAGVLENALKLAFHRLRPESFFGAAPETYSFPSGHAMFATCFYGAVAFILIAGFRSLAARAAIWMSAAIIVLSIGLSRVYLGVHYPSDVLAGYLVGSAWLTLLRTAGAFTFAARRV